MLGLLVLLPSLASATSVPPSIASVIGQHCLRCHSNDDVLDLRALETLDQDAWSKILDAVQSYKMPPPVRTDDIANRFPLPPGLRAQLVAELSTLLGKSIDRRIFPRHISFADWLSLVKDFAQGALPAGRLDALAASAFGGLLLSAEGVQSFDHVFLQPLSAKVCDEIAKAELARPLRARALLAGISPATSKLDKGAARRVVQTLNRALYQVPPSPEDAAADLKFLREAHDGASSWVEAWTHLCAMHLSGPRVLYLYSGASR